MLLNSEEIFKRLMTTCKTKTLKELSEYLGYKYNWATTTKKREGIPFEACAKVFEKKGISMDYLLYGIENNRNDIKISELKMSIAEGVFTLIQLKMIETTEGVKISMIADEITKEIRNHFDIKDIDNQEKTG